VATTTKRRPPAKPRSGTARKRPAQTKARKPGKSTLRLLSEVLGRQSDDVRGMALLVVAALTGLGIYADLTGPFGRGLKAASGAGFGDGRILLPVAFAGVGLVLVREQPRPRPSDPPRHDPARVALGFGVLVVAVCGLLEVVSTDAGGVVGSVVGGPLLDLLAGWGASVVLGAVTIVAILVITGTPVPAATKAIVAGAGVVWRGIQSGFRWLTSVGHSADDDSVGRHPSAVLFDQGDPEPSDEPRPARPKPPKEPEIHLPVEPVGDAEQLSIALGPQGQQGAWRLPPLALLKRAPAAEINRKEVEAEGRALEDALAAHGVETRLVGMTVGPTVTRYELELGPGVKVARVTSLHKDIAYAMASPDVRILAPIPGRSAIGVEVPNKRRQLVALGDIMLSEEARQATHPLEVGMGRDIAGRAVMENLAEMPHILIAGATGAGKSSCINSLLTSILVRATPDQIRMILVDPKRVELGHYNGLPHLLTQVVINPKKAANALSWAVHEMDRRSDLLAEVGYRDITGYNSAFDRGELVPEPGVDKTYERLPFILCVVDELNDLMMVAARDVEESICRIAQMGRAFGIHLVIATQRPSVDVITGVIKANIPSRLAFSVSSLADSRVILDQPGAERLVGKGDMLLLTASSSNPRRIQGPWVSEEEVRKVVAHWRRQAATPQYVDGVEGDDITAGNSGVPGGDDGDDDEMLEAAMELVVRSQLGSVSMLQRKLRLGFARAGRVMDLLERRGIVGPSEGSKARAVLMTPEEFDELIRSRS
jgi:DNA segregation ATPase FtsK/SpoIIIE, S-DNA-T family